MVQQLLQDSIRASGSISLERYMALCNTHYYNTRDPLGRGGDFITAPEVSQMFGELLGIWVADLWMKMGEPAPFTLLECGPGRGTLMADLLRATRMVPGFHQALEITLLETSAALRALQKQAIQHDKVNWVAALDDLHAGGDPLICIGNEFLDALPIRQFKFTGGTWHERHVIYNDPAYLLVDVPQAEALTDLPATPEEGDIVERSPAIDGFLRELGKLIALRGGAALFIDYGYATTAYGDTLQALKEHAYHNPLHTPGEADLTAHVNFERVGDVMKDSGLTVLPAITQGTFLQFLGLRHRADKLKSSANAQQKQDIDLAVQRLAAPEQMGTLFKVIAATSSPTLQPAGFL